VYVALPFTWWLDTTFFSKKGGPARTDRPKIKKKATAVV